MQTPHGKEQRKQLFRSPLRQEVETDDALDVVDYFDLPAEERMRRAVEGDEL